MSNNARESEAKDSTATVEFRGHSFVISREWDDMSVDFVESLEEGKIVGIVRGALGPDQWRVVRSMDLKVRDLNELSDSIAQALGFGSPGESSPSSD